MNGIDPNWRPMINKSSPVNEDQAFALIRHSRKSIPIGLLFLRFCDNGTHGSKGVTSTKYKHRV